VLGQHPQAASHMTASQAPHAVVITGDETCSQNELAGVSASEGI
jgi:hypothetical protein